MDTFFQDLRVALRSLRRMPQFTLPVVLVLALGLGATAAMVGALRTALFADLPYASPQQIHRLWWDYREGKSFQLPSSWPLYLDLKARLRTASAVEAFTTYRMNITGDGEPEQAVVGTVTTGFFDVFQIQPLVGTVHWAPEASRGVVITEGLWSSRFARDPGILNRTLRLNGEDHLVIGVVPGSVAIQQAQIFAPLVPSESQRQGRYKRFLTVYLRLVPGHGPAQLKAELEGLTRTLGEEHSGQQEASTRLVAGPEMSLLRKQNRTVGAILALATGLLVAITLVNLANAVLARALASKEETALRLALGANTWAALRPRLAESLWLSLAGAALGTVVAEATLGLLRPVVSLPLQAAHPLAVDGGLLVDMALGAVLLALLMAWIPGLLLSRSGLSPVLNASGRGLARGPSRHLRVSLVVVQVALALTLVASFASAQGALRKLLAGNLGLRPEGVAVFTCVTRDKRDEASKAIAAQRAKLMVERLKAIPGVRQAGSIGMLPVEDWGWNFGSETLRRPRRDNEWVEERPASPELFEALGISLLQGRGFTPADLKGEDASVALISEAMARTFYPGESAVGQAFRYNDRWIEVAGVVSDVRNAGPGSEAAQMVAYFPSYLGMLNTSFVVRFDPSRTMDLNAIRQVAREVAPDWPVTGLRPMNEVVAANVEGVSIQMRLMGLAGGLALLLALAGLHSLLSYLVAQRTREFGIRSALGATAADIFRLVLKRGLWTSTLGIVAGLACAIAAGRLLAAFLVEARPSSPASLLSAATMLLAGSILASLLPAFRAAGIQPAEALRQT